MGRRLGITKRISLSDLADGWDDCYVLVKPLTYQMLAQLTSLDTNEISEAEAIAETTRLVKENVVGGKVMVLGDDDTLQSANFETDDVDSMSVDMVNHIMAEMSGQGAQYGDPKALATPLNSDASQSTSKASETSSSTD